METTSCSVTPLAWPHLLLGLCPPCFPSWTLKWNWRSKNNGVKGFSILVIIGVNSKHMCIYTWRERETRGGGWPPSPKALWDHVKLFLKFWQKSYFKCFTSCHPPMETFQIFWISIHRATISTNRRHQVSQPRIPPAQARSLRVWMLTSSVY